MPGQSQRKSQRKLAAIRAHKREAQLASRRRALMRIYPHVPTQAWANMGDGLQGVGGRALRQWLASVAELVAKVG